MYRSTVGCLVRLMQRALRKDDQVVRGDEELTRRNRVFYVGMITPDAYGRAVGEAVFSGAAERKMISVVRAMRSVGLRALIVSLPFVGTGSKRAFYGPVMTSDDGCPAVFVATLRSKYLRKILGPFFLAAFFWRRIRPDDRVILYNHAVEYLLALVLLRMKGVSVYQDIEDVPHPGERGLRGTLNHLGFALTSRLTERRKVVVAEHVAHSLGLKDYLVIRGVASPAPAVVCAAKWAELHSGKALKLHYGGSLMHDTGVNLFCAAVEMLAQDADRLARPVVLHVTGSGSLNEIREVQARIACNGKVRLDVQEKLSRRDYDALIASCHASLSLRRPGAGISNTTFPSKVIEITERGVALVSSDRGDVITIFEDQSAFLLSNYEASELAATIADMTRDPARLERVARAGQEVCLRTFSPQSVGKEMARLL